MNDAQRRTIPGGEQAPPERELQAVTALYTAEISANVGELQVTTNLALALLAFLGVVGFAFDEIKPTALILTPAVALMVCTYLMARVAVVIRRASLARAYEVRISELGGFADPVRQGFLGSTFYGSVDDISIIRAAGADNLAAKFNKFVRLGFASVAAAGAYIISFFFTLAVIWNAWTRDGIHAPSGVILTGTVAYPIAWLLFFYAAHLLIIRGFPPPFQLASSPHTGDVSAPQSGGPSSGPVAPH